MHSLPAQNAHWQQYLNYKINANLDDVHHFIHGNIEITYQNNSPDRLSFIYLHLWANAYSSKKTAFAKQMLENGNVDFRYAKDDEMGWIDSFDFKSDNCDVRLEIDRANPDIARLILSKPLEAGQSITFSTPFRIKIPKTFSRMGTDGQGFYISQWYPKPAVYDKDGWHPMPYLDQGEFYGDYASYDVNITLPANYVVAATGNLTTASEIDFLKRLEQNSRMQIRDSTVYQGNKTLNYQIDQVHDFAWFADKRFNYLSTEETLPNGKKVLLQSFFLPKNRENWQFSLEYLQKSLMFYSNQIGMYPYRTLSAVDGDDQSAGAMEYPTITLVGACKTPAQLDLYITHEVGHNWFYGILGSNERDNPWMDEGVNSFYESKYMSTYYPDMRLAQRFGHTKLAKLLDVDDAPFDYEYELAYLMAARQNSDQAISLKSMDFSEQNYGAIVYAKSVLVFKYLEDYLGSEVFGKAMRNYFKQYQYQHPTPDDLKSVFEEVSGKNLDWFFGELLHSTEKVDFGISKIRKNKEDNTYLVKIKNFSALQSPVSLSVFDKNDSLLSKTWYEGFAKKKLVNISAPEKSYFVLDAKKKIPDFNRSNNSIKSSGFIKKLEPVRFQFLGSLENPYKSQVNYLPIVAWNNTDKIMGGIAIYGNFIPPRPMDYLIAPMYAFGSNKMVGVANFRFHFYPRGVQKLNVQLGMRRFSYANFYNGNKEKTQSLLYQKISPKLDVVFRNRSARSSKVKSLSLVTAIVRQAFENDFEKNHKEICNYWAARLSFNFADNKAVNPYKTGVYLEAAQNALSLNFQASYNQSYNKAKNRLRFSFFSGFYLFNKGLTIDNSTGFLPPRPSLTLSTNAVVGNTLSTTESRFTEDYFYERFYLDRSATDKVFSHQVFLAEGGFRSLFATGLGNSEKWICSLNADLDLPKHIPLKFFAAVGTGYLFSYKSNQYKNGEFVAEAGLSLVAWPDVLEIHFPLLTTNNIKKNQADVLNLNKFYEKITFTLNLDLANPFDLVKNISF